MSGPPSVASYGCGILLPERGAHVPVPMGRTGGARRGLVLGGGSRQRARRVVDEGSTPPEKLNCVTWGDAKVGQGRVGREVQEYPLEDEGGAVWLEERRQGVQQMVERGDLKIEGGDDGYPQSRDVYEDGVQGGSGNLSLP